MITELITAGKYIGFVIGGGSATYGAILLKNWLGKTKQEVEIVLKWEEIHAARDKKLLAEIKRLEDKIEAFSGLIDDMREAHNKEKLVWQDNYHKQEKYINSLELDIETLRNDR